MAGDPDGPTSGRRSRLLVYWSLPTGWTIILTVDYVSTVGTDPVLAQYRVIDVCSVPWIDYAIASV